MITILNRRVLVVAAALAALGGLVTTSLCLGEPSSSPVAAWSAALDPGRAAHVVVAQVRLPRALLAVVTGAGLAAAGVLLQDALRNPIAGPELLGVSSGAAVVVAAIVVLGLGVPVVLQTWLALLGALVVGSLVLATIGRTRHPDAIVLVGAAVSAACGGLVVAIVGLGTQGDVVALFRYLLGSLAARGWPHLETIAPFVAVGLVGAWFLRHRVEALTLGDEVATGLGVPVVTTRTASVVLATVVAAAVAAVCGPIAFVALLAPHLARTLCGTTRTSQVLMVAVLLGAVLLASADLVSRLLLYPVELPVGIATTLVGVPVLVLLRRTERAAA